MTAKTYMSIHRVNKVEISKWQKERCETHSYESMTIEVTDQEGNSTEITLFRR
jgi:hypothetical protein